MNTFDTFVRSLGLDAQRYTPEELHQLHRDVQVFAEIIIAVYRARERAGQSVPKAEDRIQELPF